MHFNNNQPLGLPAGSIRAVIALILVVPVAVLTLTSGVKLTSDQIIGLVTLIVSAYFIQKAATEAR